MSSQNWRDLADDLEAHGVPERRAQIVALVAQGEHSYQEVADLLNVDSKGSVGNQIRAYRKMVDEAEWLVDEAPRI